MVQNVIQRHLARIRGPVIWGVDDCCAFVHQIVKETHGIALMAPVGYYSTEKEAALRLRQYAGGDVLDAALKRAAELDLKRIHYPEQSAVGVVAGQRGPLLALFNRDRWLVRSHDGIDVLPDWSAVIAWELPPCRR